MQILNRLKERSPIAADPVETYRAACYAAKVRILNLSIVSLNLLN